MAHEVVRFDLDGNEVTGDEAADGTVAAVDGVLEWESDVLTCSCGSDAFARAGTVTDREIHDAVYKAVFHGSYFADGDSEIQVDQRGDKLHCSYVDDDESAIVQDDTADEIKCLECGRVYPKREWPKGMS